MQTISVGVFDEHAIFAHGASAVLRDDPLVRHVSLDVADAALVDVAVVSLGMVSERPFSCPVVACASSSEVARHSIQKSGVAAVLARDDLSPDQLCGAVHAAAAGLRIHWEMAPGAGTLDDRSCAVLRMLAAGAGTREISAELGYSERTIKGTIQQLQQALGARSRAHAVALAVRSALI